MGKLSGRVAVVTGGTTGIGLATVRLFAAEGAKVIATGRNPDTLAAARKELPREVEVVQSDAGDPAQVRRLFEQVGRAQGRIDVLFVKITADDGNYGWGEATLEGHTEAVEGSLDELISRFVGYDPEYGHTLIP